MSRRIKFYILKLLNEKNDMVDCNMADLFNYLESLRDQNAIRFEHNINGKSMKFFRFKRATIDGDKEFIVPFGSLKKGITYEEDTDNTGEVNENTKKLYDITFLYINSKEGISFITVDKAAPTYRNICDYMNQLINTQIYCFSMCPITINEGMKSVEEARIVKNITFKFDLSSSSIAKFKEIKNYGLLNVLQLCAENSYNIDGKRLSLTIRTGRGKSNKLNKDQLILLLNELDLDDDIIEEIEVGYKNNESEKISTAKLKDSNKNLVYEFPNAPKNSLTSAFLLDNVNYMLDQNRIKYSCQVRKCLAHVQTPIIDIKDAVNKK